MYALKKVQVFSHFSYIHKNQGYDSGFHFYSLQRQHRKPFGCPLKTGTGTGSGHKLVVRRPVPRRAEDVSLCAPVASDALEMALRWGLDDPGLIP